MADSVNAVNNVNMVTARIQDIKLFKYSKKDGISIMGQFVEMSVYQSLFKPIIEIDLIINDPIALHTNYPIVGEEQIDISLIHTSDDTSDPRAVLSFFNQLQSGDTAHSTVGAETITLSFAVTACRQMYPDDKARSALYSLKLFSMPFIENAKTNVMKAFNKPYHEGIQDLLKDYLKVDSTRVNAGNFEQSKNSILTIVPNMLPFQAIQWFSSRAVPADTTHYNYFFWESLFGYNFKTLQKLIDDGKKNQNKKSYIYYSNVVKDSTLSAQQQTSIQQSTITSIAFGKRYATQEKIVAGYYENEYLEIDIFNKKVTSTPFTLPKTVLPGSIANNALNTPDFITSQQSNNSLPGTKTRVRYAIGQNGGDDPAFPNNYKDKFGPGVAALAGLGQIRVTIAVPGDTRVVPGDIVEVQIPTMHGFNEVLEEPYVSGLYIVTDMKHLISSGMDHIMTLELARDSLGQLIKMTNEYKVNAK